MHKLAKGLKKKKKQKKGKKGADDDEFNPEELERYRKERAEAQLRAAESGEPCASESGIEPATSAAADSDEWRKFAALTAGVDSILKKSQGDLDRIKSTSFFQRKLPDPKPTSESNEPKKSKRWVGFDESGNPVSERSPEEEEKAKVDPESGNGFVEVPDDDEDGREDSADEDVFDTTYVDVLQQIDVQLAYIPDSPTEEEPGDDPFDTTTADKVLKTVDKHGNKLVSLGNAVEVLSGRIDYTSSCKISRPRKARNQDLLLADFEGGEPIEGPSPRAVVPEPIETTKTLLDDDDDLPDIPVDLTKLPPVLPKPVTDTVVESTDRAEEKEVLDVSEFEVLRERTLLEEIPDLDEGEFDLDAPNDEVPLKLEEAEDPFSAKEPENDDYRAEIIEASFEAATFVDEEDPFDTTFAENLVPGKTELKFIEKELEDLPVSEVAISLTDPAGLCRDYETGLVTEQPELEVSSFGLFAAKKDLLGGSVTDLKQLADQPIDPLEEITYVDPFDTSGVQELPPGKTELKFLERELLGEESKDSLSDDDFDPRGGEEVTATTAKSAPPRPRLPDSVARNEFVATFDDAEEVVVAPGTSRRKPSRPEELGLAAPGKTVAFELPTPSQRPDLLKTSEEEKSIRSKPLTPYTQKSFEDEVASEEEPEDVDPFDTSFVAKVAPGKKELKLIESELLKSQLPHSSSDQDLNQRTEPRQARRFSDFSATTVRPKSLKIVGVSGGEVLSEEPDSSQKASIFGANDSRIPSTRTEQKRQDSLLDTDFEVDAKPLTPKIESKIPEEELSYADPFDTSIAVNILPGKAELKLLESELNQIPPQTTSNFVHTERKLSDDLDFDPRAGESKKPEDFLSSTGLDTGHKVLTPYQKPELPEDEIDPFDTSFASLDPGKTELKLLESELIAE